MSAVVIGTLLSLLGLFGLVLAGGAIDNGMYQFGIALFGFAVLFDLWLIKKYFDANDGR
jgi:ABC-type maltose transport system permease subunit